MASNLLIVASLITPLSVMLTLQGCGYDPCSGKVKARIEAGNNLCLDLRGDMASCDAVSDVEWCWAGDNNRMLCVTTDHAGMCLADDGEDPFTSATVAETQFLEKSGESKFLWHYHADGTLVSLRQWSSGGESEDYMMDCARVVSSELKTGSCDTAGKFKFLPQINCPDGQSRGVAAEGHFGFLGCENNSCICENGIGAVGQGCPSPGAAQCARCNEQYMLQGTLCVAAPLPTCTCTSNAFAGAILCDGQSGESCEDATWECFHVGEGFCTLAGPSCRAKAELEASAQFADLDKGCQDQNAKQNCEEQGACQWTKVDIFISWVCENPKESDIGCGEQMNKDGCESQIGCSWTWTKGAEQHCSGVGALTPCRGQGGSVDPNDACTSINSQVSCESQFSCAWDSSATCTCPKTNFGEHCEENVSVYQQHGGLCLPFTANEVDVDRCHSLTYWSREREELGETGMCAGNQNCADWQRIRNSLSTMFTTSVIDLSADVIGCICGVVFVGASWNFQSSEEAPNKKSIIWATVAMLALAFLCDIVTQIIFLDAATSAEEPVHSFVASFCFSQGSGYEAIVEVKTKFEETRRNSIVMMIVAICGELAGTIQTMCCGKKDRWTPLSIALVGGSLVCMPFELAFGIFDFTVNTLELITGIEAIEKAILGIEPLEKGHVCVGLNPLLKSEVSGYDVSIPAGNALLFAILGGILMLTLGFCIITSCCRVLVGRMNS